MVKEEQKVMYGAFGGAKYMLVGPTGAGKTTFVSKLVNPNASSLISQMIGNGKSTLTPKTFVLSEEPELRDHIRLCAKPNIQPMNRKDYDEVIIDAFSSLAKQAAKENVKHVETAEYLLTKGFIKGENHVSFLGLLKNQAEDWIAETAVIMENVSREELRRLYNIAREKTEEPEAAKAKMKNSESIDTKLAEVFRDYLDGLIPSLSGQEIANRLVQQYVRINTLFHELATQFFNDETHDGYFTLHFPLDNNLDEELEEKKNAFFNNNSNEDKISMEVLYEDIVVYVGINLGIVHHLGENGTKFRNRNDVIEFGLIDTMGAFHRYGDKSEVRDYLLNLSKKHDYNGLILLIPLTLEANEKKFVQLSQEFFRQFAYDLDVVIISNKVDRFIDQFKKEWKSKNIFNDPFADVTDSMEQEVDTQSLKDQLVNTVNLIQQEFTEIVQEQGNGRVRILAHLTTSFVEQFDTMSLNQLKLLPQTVLEMIRMFAESKKHVHKIDVEFDDSYGSDIGIDINRDVLLQGIIQMLQQPMFDQVEQNCNENDRIIPHGNSFNALPSRLRFAEGYKSDLHERFVNVKSFEITFPETILDSLESLDKDIQAVLRDCITFNGVKNISTEVKDALVARVCERISVKNITATLVYTKTFQPVMTQPHFSFGTKFQSYIENVKCFLTRANQCDAYREAFEKEVRRSFKTALDSDVVYRRRA